MKTKNSKAVFELEMKCQREGQPRQYCRLLQLADCLDKRRSYKIRAF